jgi:enoyl-CoA hydratase
LPQPTIAMLHGYVLGGGLGLALYHDFRIVAESSTLGLPEVELGWTPPWAMGRLLDVVGPTHGRWLALAGARISGAEAKAIGLVNEVVPDAQLADRVSALAGKLAALPPTAVRETKALINRMSPLRESRWDDEAAAVFERCFAIAEARTNVMAFLARRRR